MVLIDRDGFITEETVKSHVTHLLTRLDCKNRAQLAIVANSVFASEKSLLESPDQ